MAFKLECEIQQCTFIAENDDKDIMLAQFGSHQRNHELQARDVVIAPQRNDGSRVPKSERPKIAAGGSEESWNTFVTRWNNYKRTCRIEGTLATGELFECCSTELGDDIIREDQLLLEGTEEALLTAIKRLAIIPVAKTVRRSEVLQMRQEHSEGVRSFHARVKGKADTCVYRVACTHGCGRQIDYTNEVIKDVLVTGVSDPEIRRDVYGWQELDDKNVSELVTFVESKEMARDALTHSSTTSALSAYRKQKKGIPEIDNKDKEKTGKCPKCGKDYPLFKYFKTSRKYNVKPFQCCFNCKPKVKPNNNPEPVVPAPEAAGIVVEPEAAVFTRIGAISTTPPDESEIQVRLVNANKQMQERPCVTTSTIQHELVENKTDSVEISNNFLEEDTH